MDKLNDLVEMAEKADAVANLMDAVNPHDILAIAEAFRELEQRAEAAEAKLAELVNQKAAGFVNAPRKAKLFYHGESLPVDTKLFTRAAPAAVPVDLVPVAIPKEVYKVIYDECGGFVDTTANAQHIWAYCRMTILRQLEERQC